VREDIVILISVVTAVRLAVRFCVVQVRFVVQLLDHAGIVQLVAERVPDGHGVVVIVVVVTPPHVYAVPVRF
jgi:hypothetical protein